jgi:cytochrome c peroxidase
MKRTTTFLVCIFGAVFPGPFASGEVADEYLLKLPLGLQQEALYLPPENPLTAEKIALGKQLFFDRRLSRDRSLSCASCHNPRFGFADGQPVSIGIGGQKGSRNAPTIINRAFSKEQFLDGRAADLEDQVKGPMVNPLEMGFTHEEVVRRLREIKGYRDQFERVFGSADIEIDQIAQAIAAFERTVLSGNSPFDRYAAGDTTALSPAARRGFALFRGETNCFRCHVGFNFTDENFRNIGVGMDRQEPDPGRFAVTRQERDRGAFKTPTLRDIALTAPYFHDASARTLEDVVEWYDRGGMPNPNLAPEIKPLGLTIREKADLVEFMKALTGEIALEVMAPALPQ